MSYREHHTMPAKFHKRNSNSLYCLKCGSRMDPVEPYHQSCPVCDYQWFENGHPCAAVIMTDEHGRILLVKRAKDPGKGWWDLPGGFTTGGETGEEAAIREIKEELDVDLTELQYLGSYVDHYRYGGVNSPTLCLVFLSPYLNVTPKPLDDVAEVKWLFPSQISHKQIFFKSIRQALKDFLKSR